MALDKRQKKEQLILDAAEQVFFTKGFAQTKMEEVANLCGLSKASIYFYFKSKEDVYMGISHRAFQKLIETYRGIIKVHQQEQGAVRVERILEGYLAFSEQHFHYHEVLFNYMALVRGAGHTEGDPQLMRESNYFHQIQSIHNQPLDIVVAEISRGKEDGSITSPMPSEMIYLTAWAMIAGFIKLNIFGGAGRSSIYQVSLSEWKGYVISAAKGLLR